MKILNPATGALTTPIYETSTYVQEAVGKHKGYDYSRVANPTRTALQRCLASLEGAEHGVAFSSGLGATTTLMHLVNPGDRVVLIADVYGGVYRMTSQVYEPKGYVFDYLPAADFDRLAEHLDDRTRLVWIETPSNPMLNIVDIQKAATAAHDAGAILAVDNTFATPFLQRPLELGADIAVHSTTKYGHERSDDRGTAHVPPEVARRCPRATRLLARATWNQDAGRPDEAALPQRARDLGLPRTSPARRAGLLPGIAATSRPRDCGAADARLRRNDLLHGRVGG